MNRPCLFYTGLHVLEVENSIRHRAFHERQILPGNARRLIIQERDAAFHRLASYLEKGALIEVTIDSESALHLARELSKRHTDRLGARAIDLLHVANSLVLECEMFLTFDLRQLAIARVKDFKFQASQNGNHNQSDEG